VAMNTRTPRDGQSPAGSASQTGHIPRVLLLGATGTIGRATYEALRDTGHEVVCLVRGVPTRDETATRRLLGARDTLFVSLEDAEAVQSTIRHAGPFSAVVSCLASRTGVPGDAWAVDYQAHMNVLAAARASGIPQMILLSAICVQKPRLAFQHAKLAFEAALADSGLDYVIVRPTAFFKSLSGQIERLRAGKPFLLFGDGTLTACKPISDRDLARFLVDCMHDPARSRRILPIGGPGPAITPRAQGEMLHRLLGRAPRFRSVTPKLLDLMAALLGLCAKLLPRFARYAELARIGHYYATESMLVWDETHRRYDADATPSTGSDTLLEHYRSVLDGTSTAERGDHAVF